MKSKYSLPKDGGLIAESTPRDILHRYEKMPTTVFETESEGAQCIADRIVAAINAHRGTEPFALGLTTGHTPLGLYRELAERHARGEVSFRNVAVYSLDEFYPIASTEQQSRNYRIHEDLLNHVDILPENVHILDGTLPKEQLAEYCDAYDKAARKIDLMIIGIGEDGQIGFNEPGSYAKSRTRLVQLSHGSRKTQAGAFHSLEHTPKMAITMGIDTVMHARRIILMAWGENKARILREVVEGEVSAQVPASHLQAHADIEVVTDENAAQLFTREVAPWLVGPCRWTPKFIRKAVVWLCGVVDKPILKLTYKDYIENSLGELLEQGRTFDQINIDVFNDLQHTISGWPGGKPNADDTTRPVPSSPFPKRVVVFSPHPDDDVISMGGTFIRLVQQGHDVHVAYETSGNVAVHDDVVLQHIDAARELGYGDRYAEVERIIAEKKAGEPEPRALLELKGAIRRSEARGAVRSFGLNPDTNAHFLNLPFYETGGIKKGQLSDADTEIIVKLLREVKPHQIYAAGDLADPHGTHRVCMEAVLEALEVVKNDDWMKECHLWLYRGAWMEWDLGMVDMAVPLSPDELIKKRHAIYRHLSQKDIMPFPGDDPREFWQRAEERTQNTARLYDKLGMAEYQAIEVFVRMF
ncbi:6-phosphogluconolactonase [uncultured Alistipes sp.]|uniref:6-phosphogluconolactonase n=2 Tax=uncultured Alistipes sp. TaxID=538949 RepID=UPI000E861EBD|nr:6-phosphogluconolactonase [uncultured Alistipes sp.]HBX89729.1 glucosamine-6-phosphate deaminase [Alistipes sp.]HCN13661.1 glucosamine-6-phosphate deaminase [Alistipes sp.]